MQIKINIKHAVGASFAMLFSGCEAQEVETNSSAAPGTPAEGTEISSRQWQKLQH